MPADAIRVNFARDCVRQARAMTAQLEGASRLVKRYDSGALRGALTDEDAAAAAPGLTAADVAGFVTFCRIMGRVLEATDAAAYDTQAAAMKTVAQSLYAAEPPRTIYSVLHLLSLAQ